MNGFVNDWNQVDIETKTINKQLLDEAEHDIN